MGYYNGLKRWTEIKTSFFSSFAGDLVDKLKRLEAEVKLIRKL